MARTSRRRKLEADIRQAIRDQDWKALPDLHHLYAPYLFDDGDPQWALALCRWEFYVNRYNYPNFKLFDTKYYNNIEEIDAEAPVQCLLFPEKSICFFYRDTGVLDATYHDGHWAIDDPSPYPEFCRRLACRFNGLLVQPG